MTNEKIEVFVYGTLKRGGRLHHCLTDSEYVGEAIVRGRLYDVGAFPALVHDDHDDRSFVRGELYSVDADTLQYLDVVEGTPFLYRREEFGFYHIVGGDGMANPKEEIMEMYSDGRTVETYVFNRLSDDMPRIHPTERTTWNMVGDKKVEHDEVFFIANDIARR